MVAGAGEIFSEVTMAMTPEIVSAIRAFKKHILTGVPFLLKQNETAFLSFMCCVSAIDALGGYRYEPDDKRFKKPCETTRYEEFIKEYFPPTYAAHAKNLYTFRCRLLHNFSPANSP